jgi:hypothetical protein
MKNILSKVFSLFFILFFNLVIAQQSIIFRFNADYDNGNPLQNDYLNNVDISTRVDEIEEVARGNEESWGYSSRKTAYFPNSLSHITSSEAIIQSFFGAHTLSGEIWIKPFENTGKVLNWGANGQNSIDIRFFESGLIFNHKINDTNYQLEIEYSFGVLEWYHINWFSKVLSDSISIGMYINGTLVIDQIFSIEPTGLTYYNSPITIGYNNLLEDQGFRGEIYALNIKNYFSDNQYNSAFIPFDGSAYFGIPKNHDYEVGSSNDNVDQRIFFNPTEVNNAVFVPYQNDDFIPQGVTNSFEDNQLDPASDGMVYISLYHKPQTGQTGLIKSIIVELNPLNNHKVRRCFRLNGYLRTAHNGGIAFKNNKIYVSSIYKIEAYEIPPYENGSEKYIDLYSDSENLYSVDCQSSFVTYFNDTLWVGEYRTSTESIPYLLGYPMSESGTVLTSQDPAVYRLPRRSQGVAWRILEEKKYLYISQSNGGSNYGKIYRCLRSGLSIGEEPVIDTVFNIPSGAEDLSFNQYGDLLTVSESGANYFHDSWAIFYPFYYSIPDTIINETSDNSLSVTSFPYAPVNDYEINVYPNPTNNSLNINYRLDYWSGWKEKSKYMDLNIYNLLGELVYNESKVIKDETLLVHRIDVSEFSSGSYIITLFLNGEFIVSNYFVNLK